MLRMWLISYTFLYLTVGFVASVPTRFPGTEQFPIIENYPLLPIVENVKDESEARSIVESAYQTYYRNTVALLESSNTTCTLENVSVRRAWDDLTADERTEYIDAVLCMTTMPTRTDRDIVPGVRTLYDDFVWAHTNQTMLTHGTALLLPYHRQLVWAWEQALRTECGYKGALPYWAWERHMANQSLSPVFTSFGGNGAFNSSGGDRGCIEDGPFVHHTAHIGPILTFDPTTHARFNPHCITRDFDQPLSSWGLNYAALATLWQDKTMHEFNPRLERGIHHACHGFVGGELYNLYSSPNDPIFHLLHAQIDRVWTIWQGMDPDSRRWALHGTLTRGDKPPSANGTVDSIMDMGVLSGGKMRMYEAMDVLGGTHCYMYA